MIESDISLAFLCCILDVNIRYKISIPKHYRALRPTVLYLSVVLCLLIAHVLLTTNILPKCAFFSFRLVSQKYSSLLLVRLCVLPLLCTQTLLSSDTRFPRCAFRWLITHTKYLNPNQFFRKNVLWAVTPTVPAVCSTQEFNSFCSYLERWTVIITSRFV